MFVRHLVVRSKPTNAGAATETLTYGGPHLWTGDKQRTGWARDAGRVQEVAPSIQKRNSKGIPGSKEKGLYQLISVGYIPTRGSCGVLPID